jgi:hypothetical protein
MERFEFNSRQALDLSNGRIVTLRGAIEIYPDWIRSGFMALGIRGPKGSLRGEAVIDKATARKLGVALLEWAVARGELAPAILDALWEMG